MPKRLSTMPGTVVIIPFLPYMDITTIILHTIAFAAGIVAALVCRLLRLK